MKQFNYKFLIMFLVVILSIFVIQLNYEKNKTVLTLGIFVESYWDVPTSNAYAVFDAAIEKFEQEYEHVTVSYYTGFQKEDYTEYIAELALTGDLPDVFMIMQEDFPTYAQVGMLESLNIYIAQEGIDLETTFYQTAYESAMYENNLYAFPYESVPTFMVVNKTLLEENGLSVPDTSWTWDDFYEMCELLTQDTDGDGIIDQFGSYNYTWETALYTNGASVFNEDGSINIDTNEFEELIEFVKKVNNLNVNESLDSQDFDEGKVAFQPMLYSDYRTYEPYPYRVKRYSEFEWELVPLPSKTGESEGYSVNTLLMGISSTSSNKEEAFAFLNILCNDDEIQSLIYTESQGASPKISVTGSIELLESLSELSDIDLGIEYIDDVMANGVSQHNTKDYEQIISFIDTELYIILNSSDTIVMDLSLLKQKIETYIND